MSGQPDFPTCGLWPVTDGRARASVLDGDGRLYRVQITPTDEEECWDSLHSLQRDFGLDLHLVVPEPLTQLQLLVRSALLRDMPVLVAPSPLIESIAAVAFSRPRSHHYASILARLPDSRFRGHLRILPPRDPRQLELL
jgi:hypothetical protein